ncbi:MAG TPA: restriction endonuclease, partial [Chthoniobacterales bacterium]|jgi:restriction system protein
LSAIRALSNRLLLDKQTNLGSLRELPWKRFENLLGEAYRRLGYKVEESLGGGADGGVDLVLGRGREVVLVQCKRWKTKPVPVQTVRELYGVLHDRNASAAKLVATTRFTSEAVAFAKGKPIELVDQDSLLELISGVQTSGSIAAAGVSEQDNAAPVCPKCGSGMVKRTAKRGPNPGSSFWGCAQFSAGCRGTRPLSEKLRNAAEGEVGLSNADAGRQGSEGGQAKLRADILKS